MEGQVSETSKNDGLTAVYSYELTSTGDVDKSYETSRGDENRVSTRQFNLATGNIATSTDRYGQVTSFAYDSIDRLVSVWDSQNSVTKFYTNDPWEGQVSETSKNDGLTAVYSYELTSTGDVDKSYETSRGDENRVSTRQFNLSTGNIATSTDRYGQVTSFDYDSIDRLVSVWDSQNSVTKFYTNDPWEGQVSETSKNDGLTAVYSYELTSTGDVDKSYETSRGDENRVSTRQFNLATGNIATSTDRYGQVTSFDYDSIDRLVSVWDSQNSVTKFYTNDPWEGQVSETSKNDGLTAVYSYELTSTGDVDKSYETSRGDENRVSTRQFNLSTGNIATSTDRYGQVTSFDYDSIDRLVSVWDSQNSVTKFYTNDPWEGQVSETSKNDGLTAVYSYELTSTGDVDKSYETSRGDENRVSTRQFNLATGNIATSTDRYGQVTSFDYDSIDRLVSVWDSQNSVTKFYTNDPWEGQVSETSKNDGLTAVYSYELTSTGDVDKSYETSRGDENRVSTRQFNLSTGNIATSTDRYGQVSSFAYDSIDRLVSVWDSQNSVTKFYTNDPWEGQVSETSKNDGLTAVYSYELTSTGDVDKSYETSRGDENRVSTRQFNLATGNIATSTDRYGQVSSFDYDSIDRLVSVWDSQNSVTKFYTNDPWEGQVSETSKNDGLTAVYSYELTSTGDVDKSYETSRGDENRVSTRQFNLATGNIATSTDRYGQVSSFDYDSIDRLVSVWDSQNSVTKFYTNDPWEGQVSETSKNDGLTAVYSYELTSTGDVDKSYETSRGDENRVSTRQFNLSTGNIATSTDRYGQVTSFDYDSIDRLVSVWDSQNSVTKFYTNDPWEGQVSETSKNDGLTAVYSYELTSTGDVDKSYETSRGDENRVSTRQFNLATGNIATSTDRYGQVTSFDYDSIDRLVSVWDSQNSVTKFYTNDPWEGQVSETSKNDGLTAVYSYELTSTGDVDKSYETSRGDENRVSTRQFNLATGNIATSTDRYGQVTSFDYDSIDRLVSVWDSQNSVTKFYTNDPWEGQVSETSKNDGLTAVYSYELTSTGDVDKSYETSRGDENRVSTRQFNLATGNIATSTDRYGQVTSFDYDSIDRLVSVWDSQNSVTKFYTNDPWEGQVSETSKNDGLTAVYSYELTSTGDVDKSYETSRGDENRVSTRQFNLATGNIATSTDRYGQVTSFDYDSIDRLVSVWDSQNSVTKFYTNDPWEGQVSETSKNDGLTAVYSYELTSTGDVDKSYETSRGDENRVSTRQFNLATGNIATSTDRYGQVTSFDYDSIDRLVSVWDSQNSVTKFYTNDPWEGQVSETSKNDVLTAVYSYELTSTGDVDKSYETSRGDENRVSTRQFNLATGNIATSTDRYGQVTSFDYDSIDRLVSVWDSQNSVTKFYTNDPWEGQVSETSKNDVLTAVYSYELTSTGDVDKSYETSRGDENRVSTRQFNLATGNIATSTDRYGQVTSFDYDSIDRLVSVWDSQNSVTKFYTNDPWEGQVSETSKNDGLTAVYSYELTSTGDVDKSYETSRGDENRVSTRQFNLSTGNIATSTDRYGQVTSFDYDSIDRLVSVWDSQNSITKFYTNDPWEGQVSETSKNDGLTAVYSYELTSTGDVDKSYETSRGDENRVSTRQFNLATGNIATSTDRYGQVTSFAYDSIDRLVSVWDSQNSVTKFYTNDPWEGQVSETSKNDGLTAVYSYELTSTGDVDKSYETSRGDENRVSTRQFNLATGNIATSTDRYGQVTSFDYDSIDRLVSVWDSQNSITKFYTNDPWEGQVSETSKNDGLTAVYSYELTSTGDVDKSYETSRGDENRVSTRQFNLSTGNIATSTDRYGQVTHLLMTV